MKTPTLEAVKATPAAGALVTAWLDVPLQTWQIRVGLVVLLLQAAYMLWKWWREFKQARKDDARG